MGGSLLSGRSSTTGKNPASGRNPETDGSPVSGRNPTTDRCLASVGGRAESDVSQ
ncbi:hypothetical protein KFK09_029446 [Dendrobium nobile]|uniref:Uncharacterized protein n=1 Tax=Dendrobium nobile TaxID=94219 RepID=A0A8T3A0D4_DENNO|nr:hypothetical protein KFK09_029446 [Dendrobium nobile]